MTERLALSDDQVQQLNVILDTVRQEYKALEKESHDAYRPRRKIIRDRQIAETMAILTPSQQVEYEKYQAERAERRRKSEEKRAEEEKATPPGAHPPPIQK